jgi:hypothetical protein
MEIDLQILFGILCRVYLHSLAETPQLPPSPRIWAYMRGRYWSANKKTEGCLLSAGTLCLAPFKVSLSKVTVYT